MGVFALNMQAWQGTVLQMLAHGLTTGALFVIAGLMQHHFHTRDMTALGGLWHKLPRFGVMAMFFAVASLGMPGLANFVGEFLILVGSFRADAVVTAVAALGLIGAAVYSLILIQRVFQGPETETTASGMSLGVRERFLLGALAVPVVVLGVAPQPVIELAAPALELIENLMPSGVLP
jgi:NADH-quinone oxidoreductase subunit M